MVDLGGRLRLAMAVLLVTLAAGTKAQDSPGLNPFGNRATEREDAVPGYLELSDGTVHPGRIFLTRDYRFKILDEQTQRSREVPLEALRRLDCAVKKEWVEKEWRFKENANDEKFYTGRTYPSREYTHTLVLQDGRTIKGPLSGIVYVQGNGESSPERFLLHKRDKGEPGTNLKALSYVRSIRLGDEAFVEGQRKAAAPRHDAPIRKKK